MLLALGEFPMNIGQQTAEVIGDCTHAALRRNLLRFGVVIGVGIDVVDDALAAGTHDELDAGNSDPVVEQKTPIARDLIGRDDAVDDLELFAAGVGRVERVELARIRRA